MFQAKTRSAIDRLSNIWKFDISNKIKYNFFQAAVELILMDLMDAFEVDREKARRAMHKNTTRYIEQIWEATASEIAATSNLWSYPIKTLLEKRSYLLSLKLSNIDTVG